MKYLNAFLIKVSKNIQIIKGGVLQHGCKEFVCLCLPDFGNATEPGVILS